MPFHKLIIVVDDDPDIGLVVHDRLTMDGYQVVVTESGQRTLELLAGMAADGLIVDFALPGMDGLELANIVRAQQATLPMIMITGQVLSEVTAKALTSGIKEVMSKPLDLQKLTSAAKKWFGAPDCSPGR